MKFSLETQFDIGDAVYTADHYHDYYANSTPHVITDIIININNRGIRTMYCVEQGGLADRFPGEWVFSTYEECTKWCDEQNKKIG